MKDTYKFQCELCHASFYLWWRCRETESEMIPQQITADHLGSQWQETM